MLTKYKDKVLYFFYSLFASSVLRLTLENLKKNMPCMSVRRAVSKGGERDCNANQPNLMQVNFRNTFGMVFRIQSTSSGIVHLMNSFWSARLGEHNNTFPSSEVSLRDPRLNRFSVSHLHLINMLLDDTKQQSSDTDKDPC